MFNTESYPNKLSEYDFLNSNFLNLYYTVKIKGIINEDFMFIDPSDASIKQLPFSKSDPKWRIINKTLKIFFEYVENAKGQSFKEGIIFKTLKIETLCLKRD